MQQTQNLHSNGNADFDQLLVLTGVSGRRFLLLLGALGYEMLKRGRLDGRLARTER